MADPFSGTLGSTKQEVQILGEAKERRKARTFGTKNENEKEKKAPIKVSELYNAGIKLLEGRGYTIELQEGGDHVNHRIMKPQPPEMVAGIKYPHSFNPVQDISTEQDFADIEAAFLAGCQDENVKDFWTPLFKPKAGDSDLLSFTQRLLKMKRVNQTKNIHQILNYGHTFDPAGRWGGEAVHNPRIWVPDRSWFDPALHDVTFADVFTIFPEAEQEMLKLILGRVGVGRSNHLPPGRT